MMAVAMAMAVAVVMAGAVAVAMAVATAVAGSWAVVNFKEYQNGLDDSRICFGGVVHGLPVAGVAIRLLSLRAG